MLQALTVLSPDTPEGICKQGDIIVLALPGQPWGAKEKSGFLIVQWDDKEMEDILAARQTAGEKYPTITYPYATFEDRISPAGKTVGKKMTARSTSTLDIAALDAQLVTDTLAAQAAYTPPKPDSHTVDSPPYLTPDQYTLRMVGPVIDPLPVQEPVTLAAPAPEPAPDPAPLLASIPAVEEPAPALTEEPVASASTGIISTVVGAITGALSSVWTWITGG